MRKFIAFSYAYALVLVIVGTIAVPSQVFASEPLASPTGKIILSVSGNLTITNGPGRADFDRAMLESLGMETIVTSTAWTTGKQTFEGVRLKSLFDFLKARGDTVTGTALNDYKSHIPFADTTTYNPLVALKQNGEYMQVRNKGPLWMVYPRDDFSELLKVKYDHRWIWQLRSLHVK